jgi:nucleoside phosphorylase
MTSKATRVIIMTALPIEYKAVASHLTSLTERKHSAGTVYQIGYFTARNHSFEVLVCETGPGNEVAAIETERAIQFFKPKLAFFVGVAGGIKDVKLYDVVVGTKVYNYSAGKEKEEFLPRPEPYHSTYELIQRARADAKQDNWQQRIKPSLQTSTTQPSAIIGAIASGEAVVASLRANIYRLIKKQYSDSLAIEMEGHGFLKAAQANLKLQAIVVRGISDLIKGKKASDDLINQEIAAQNASAFAFEILANLYANDTLGAKLPATKLLYQLTLSDNELENLEELHKWRFLEIPPHPIDVYDNTLITGSNNSTTFHIAPTQNLQNLIVECKLRIRDYGDDTSRWAGIRVRGYNNDIRFGYLVYLRATGTVELYRAGIVLDGDNRAIPSYSTKNWTHIKIAIFNDVIKVWVNSELHITSQDTKYLKKGQCYLHTFGTRTEFKDFQVFALNKLD